MEPFELAKSLKWNTLLRTPSLRTTLMRLLLLLPLLFTGCFHVKVDPIKIDATVTLRVERELDNYFDYLDSASETIGQGHE